MPDTIEQKMNRLEKLIERVDKAKNNTRDPNVIKDLEKFREQLRKRYVALMKRAGKI